MSKNTGYNLEREIREQEVTDYVLGAESVKPLFEVPQGQNHLYLPAGELQNIGEEKMSCVTRAFLNKLETDLNFALATNLLNPETVSWLKTNGYLNENKVEFSDAYIAILSGTTRQGNSLKSPADAIHNFGLIPKKTLPQLDTFDAENNPARITQAMRDLGKAFIARLPINYSRSEEKDFNKASGVIVGLYAWPEPKDGVYPRVSFSPNHCVYIWSPVRWVCFDNYLDSVDGDYTKLLAPEYDFIDIGYRIYFSGENVLTFTNEQKKSIWELIKAFLFKQPEELKKLEPLLKPVEEPKSPTQRLTELCKASIGLDLSVQAPNERGCAESVSNLLNGIFDFPRFLSTIALKSHLDSDKRFNRCQVKAWTIIVSPTVGSNIGHCGVLGDNGVIYSNNSKTGLWDKHWTLDKWIAYYRTQKGLQILLYELK